MRRVTLWRSRLTRILQPGESRAGATVGRETAKPTAPRPRNQARRAKSNPPGTTGAGGGWRTARTDRRRPGSGAGSTARMLIRMRRGVASRASRAIRGWAIVTRHPPRFESEAASIVPVTVTGPMRRSSTGEATASVRIWASEKPPARAASAIRAGPRTPRPRTQAAARRTPDMAIVQSAGSTGSAK